MAATATTTAAELNQQRDDERTKICHLLVMTVHAFLMDEAQQAAERQKQSSTMHQNRASIPSSSSVILTEPVVLLHPPPPLNLVKIQYYDEIFRKRCAGDDIYALLTGSNDYLTMHAGQALERLLFYALAGRPDMPAQRRAAQCREMLQAACCRRAAKHLVLFVVLPYDDAQNGIQAWMHSSAAMLNNPVQFEEFLKFLMRLTGSLIKGESTAADFLGQIYQEYVAYCGLARPPAGGINGSSAYDDLPSSTDTLLLQQLVRHSVQRGITVPAGNRLTDTSGVRLRVTSMMQALPLVPIASSSSSSPPPRSNIIRKQPESPSSDVSVRAVAQAAKRVRFQDDTPAPR